MRRLQINHLTRYLYAENVTLLPHSMHLRPRDGHDIRVVSSKLDISPEFRIRWNRDVYGNSVAVVTFLQAAEELSIASEVVVLDRNSKGKSTFTNVSRQLLYVTVDMTEGDGYNPKRYPLFSYSTWGYWWDYDNNGLRLAQLRFYEITTDVGNDFPIDDGGDNCTS